MNIPVLWDGVLFSCAPVVELPRVELQCPLAFAQQDTQWAADKMGGTQQTVGGMGCAMVAACMVYSQHDPTSTPKTFNEALNVWKGYNIIYGTEAHLAWDRLPAIFPSLRWLGRKDWSRLLDANELAAVLALIDAAPLILWVDFYPLKSGMQSHFVLAVGHDATDIEIIDPWFGVRGGLLARYARGRSDTLNRAIWGYRRLEAK